MICFIDLKPFIFLSILIPASSSGLSSETGKTLGYTYIAITVLILFCYALLAISKYKIKGLLMLSSQIFIFTSFCRYSALSNFEHSSFFHEMWRSYSKAQDPYEFLTCSKTDRRWAMLGFESNNFLCNSIAYLGVIAALIITWVGCFILFKSKRQVLNRLWPLLAYCTVSDLSLSAFVQVYYIDFSGFIGIAGSSLAIFYLALILTMMGFQCYYIYKRNFESFLIVGIKEDFIAGKEYYFYYFYPLLMLKVLVNMCILVFGESKRYSAPVLISIINLINRNAQSVSYIVSIRPFTHTRHLFFVIFIQIIEIFFMFLQIFYEFDSIPDISIDITSILLFIMGLLSFPLRTYTDYSSLKRLNPNRINPISNSQVQDNYSNKSSADFGKNNKDLSLDNNFIATFKDNVFKISENRKKTLPSNQIHDTKAFETKENESSKKVVEISPKMFVFDDDESSEDFSKNDENMKKTAKFSSNDYHTSMQPLDYRGVFDSSFNSSNPSMTLAPAGINFSPLSRVRRNLNEITVKSKKGF